MTQKRKKPAKPGLRALVRAVSARGVQAIDRRTAAYKATMRFRSELIDSLGGEEALSPQKLALIDGAARVRLYLDHIDSFLLEQQSLINKRSRRVITLVRDRIQVADHLSRYLAMLGLERRAKDVIDAERLSEIESELAQRDPSLLPEITSGPTDEGVPKHASPLP